MKYVYLVQHNLSTTDFKEICTELFEKFKDAEECFHEVIRSIKDPSCSEIGKHAFDENGFVQKRYELSFRFSDNKKHDQYWHLVDKNDYYNHAFVDLKRLALN